MTGTTNRYGIYEVDHTKFGGFIFSSNFNTDYKRKDNKKGSIIANRIAQDQKFDNQCRKNIKQNKKYGGLKNDCNKTKI